MTTLRELTTKLGFEADLTPAVKYKKAVRDLNVSLGSLKTTKFEKDLKRVNRNLNNVKTEKFSKSVKTINGKLGLLNKKLAATRQAAQKLKLGTILKQTFKRAATAVKDGSKKVIKGLGEFANKINLKGNIIRAAAAAAMALTGGTVLAASKESAETRIGSFIGEGELKKLKGRYKEIQTLTKGLFTETDIAKGSAAFLEVNNNVDALNKMLPDAARLAVIHGKSLGEVLTQLAEFTVTGNEAGLKNIGIYDEAEVERIRRAEKSAVNFTNIQKLETLEQQIGKRRIEREKTFQDALDNTSTKFKTLKSDLEQGVTNIAEDHLMSKLNWLLDFASDLNTRFLPEVNKILDKQKLLKSGGQSPQKTTVQGDGKIVTTPWKPTINAIPHQTTTQKTEINDNRTISIKVDSQDGKVIADEIDKRLQRESSHIYHTNKALNPIRNGANQ